MASPSPTPTPTEQAAAAAQAETDAKMALWSLAAALPSVRAIVPITLDLHTSNYLQWRNMFSDALLKYALDDHIRESDYPANPSPQWSWLDATVRSRLNSVVAPELLTMVADTTAPLPAHVLWSRIANIYHDNAETRASYLEQEFHGLQQGAMNVGDYCRKQKNLADELTALGTRITDRVLVQNTLHGLGPRLAYMRTLILNQRPLPTFLDARSSLLLEELTLVQTDSSPSAFLSKGAPSTPQPRGSGTLADGKAPASLAAKRTDPCRNFLRGRCRFGARCRYLHGSAPASHLGTGRGGPDSSGAKGAAPVWPSFDNPWAGAIQMWPGQPMRPPDHTAPPHAFVATPPPSPAWYMDTGATAHMTSEAGMLSSLFPSAASSNVIVGNGSFLPITNTGHTSLSSPNRSFYLNNVLVTPTIIKNLISVRQFTLDNNCSVEFDPFGLSVKDLRTRKEILRCNSRGDLYPFHPTPPTALAITPSPTVWHRRLGHLGREAFSHLVSSSLLPCHKQSSDPSLCHACQLGHHVRLPFHLSSSRATTPFDLIHCDLWTSPLLNIPGYKYYLVILDDISHYTWTFPLRLKSDVFSVLTNFFAHARTQFKTNVRRVQCDNGGEFDNSSARNYFLTHGIALRMSCPHTSPQNGRAECIIRTINNILRTLLIQASMPPVYWVEALHTATYLLNLHPTKPLNFCTPYQVLHQVPPSLTHLRVFGCRCYANLSATAPNKLAPRSTACVFLGYPDHHFGYRCLDLSSNRIIISRHVTFDENSFPFAEQPTPPSPADFTFLDDDMPAIVFPLARPPPTAAPAPVVPPPVPPPVPLPPNAVPVAPVVNQHDMATRGKRGFQQPIQRLNLHADVMSPIPRTYRVALNDDNRRAAMKREYDALCLNNTWELVPRPPGTNVVSGKWIYRHKLKPDGSLDRYKARWVLRGFSQQHGIDFD